MNTMKMPFYAKASLIFIGLFAFTGMLYIARGIIVPLIYSIIIAILVNPLVRLFVSKGMNRILAIAVSLILVLFTILLFLVLLSTQMRVFTQSLPQLMDKLHETISNSVSWVSSNFNIDPDKLNAFVGQTKADILTKGRSVIGSTLISIGSSLVVVVLIPVYVFMILFYKPLLLEFIRKLFRTTHHKEVNEVLRSTRTIIQRYLLALLLEALIVATLNSAGLLILGINYAILLGVIGAILNAIPYIGGIIATALPMMIALITKSSPAYYAFLVLVVYMIIQFIDNHYIIPKVVASKVRLNALISIIVVLCGGALWGVPGMFLSIPLIAIFKVICDHITPLKPVGFLLGDTMPLISIFKIDSKKSTP